MQEFPIICIIAERGEGKTLTARALAEEYAPYYSIVANFNIYDLKYRKAGIKGAMNHLAELWDTVLIFDEIKTGADAYKFWSRDVVKVTDFVTQLRKRRIIMILTIQRVNTLTKRLRDMIDIFMQVSPIKGRPGDTRIQVFDGRLPPGHDFIKEITLENGSQYFNKYDTNELIKEDDETWEEPGIKKLKKN